MRISLIAFKNAIELINKINNLTSKDFCSVEWFDFDGKAVKITEEQYYQNYRDFKSEIAADIFIKK